MDLPTAPCAGAGGEDRCRDGGGRAIDVIVGLLAATLNEATPLTLAALGGVVSERSGVVNIGLEGMMLMSAFTGYVAAFEVHNVWLGVLVGLLTGILISALHAVLSISLMVDQIVSGFVINILALGITGLFFKGFLQEASVLGPGVLPTWKIPLLSEIPIIGPILFIHQPLTYAMLIAIAAVQFLLFRTVWGLRTRAVGEHPLAADTVGVNVYLQRYGSVIISGGLAGLGGAYFSLQQIGQFLPNITGGRGFIALAAMIFGKWKPLGAFYACLLFAGAEALSGRIQISGIHIPFQFLGMLPYLLTIIVVAGAMGRAVAPAADGKPYRKA
jgi:general nucleoside transport system permease protein